MGANYYDPGYTFPQPPRNWGREERRFIMELRDLFDTLFSLTKGLTGDPDKFSYEKLSRKPKINGTELVGNKSLQNLGIDVVTDANAGFMSPAMKAKLDSIPTDATNNRPELDYLFMMTEIPLPTDTSDKKTKVAGYYSTNPKRWTKPMVWDAVDNNWITSSDYQDITGDPFPPFRPT